MAKPTMFISDSAMERELLQIMKDLRSEFMASMLLNVSERKDVPNERVETSAFADTVDRNLSPVESF